MKELLPIIIAVVVATIVFALLVRRGAFLRVSGFFRETEEELRKCTWPSWNELKGSTIVVLVAIVLLGAFTVGIDFVVAWIIQAII
ncbi:MAG: preprotein translocase subunit SecE [Limisphaerales bacterium]